MYFYNPMQHSHHTRIIRIAALLLVVAVLFGIIANRLWVETPDFPAKTGVIPEPTASLESGSAEIPKPEPAPSPMAIEELRRGSYPGGVFTIEQTLANGTNYRQMIASYLSEGLKIYGLLTIPLAPKPENGYPAIMFVHGYIPPDQYSTTGNYPTYQAALARAGFITFKPDLRGHGNSEGEPVSAHFSEKYVVDTLYAIAYLKEQEDVDPARIGYWGHSNGGEIGLRVALVSPDIKASSLWAGVVGSYPDMFETYLEDIPFLRDDTNPLVDAHGLPSADPIFWNTIDPYAHLADISIPIQLQHGTEDESVPIELSRHLTSALEDAGKTVEYFEYPGDDHNIGKNSGTAWDRTIAFYRKWL